MPLKFCPLFSGSSGNSTYIGNDDTHLLIDAGVSGKNIENALKQIQVNPYKIDGILVTHEHTDHIKSVGVLSRKFGIPIYATNKTWQAMDKKIGEINLKNVRYFDPNQDFYIKNMDITPITIPHDAADPVCFNFFSQGKKAGICTDLGYMPKNIQDSLKNCDVLLLESNHDLNMLQAGSYPYNLKCRISGKNGHLSNETCGNILASLAQTVGMVTLGHLSRDNNTADVALQTVTSILSENGITEKDIVVSVANRDRISKMYVIN